MQEFLIIAAAHFLALLSPGPDFFLIARTSLTAGWRIASGACLGIALANGVFIVAAFSGMAALQPDHALFVALQLAGCAYLLYLGVLFIRHAGQTSLLQSASATPDTVESAWPLRWRHAAGMGFLSGILNPKNALFYASLAAMLTGPHATPAWKTAYGVWMFSVVLLWDMLVVAMIGNRAMLDRLSRAMPWLERTTGALLILIALAVLGAQALR